MAQATPSKGRCECALDAQGHYCCPPKDTHITVPAQIPAAPREERGRHCGCMLSNRKCLPTCICQQKAPGSCRNPYNNPPGH